MEAYKREFIEFMVESNVLTFGDFTAKSGRKTPYFVNTGLYRTGAQIARLSRFYAQAIETSVGDSYDVLFGPAYKGIPLVVGSAMALHEHHGRNVAFCFNRKEAKDHGEGGVLVGHALGDGDRVLIVEDVTTAGTSIRETVPLLLGSAAVQLAGLIVAVDRMERGQGELNALAELGAEYGMPTFAIVTIEDIMQHLHGREVGGRVLVDDAMLERMQDYRQRYGGRAA